jgi:hypothetical protein
VRISQSARLKTQSKEKNESRERKAILSMKLHAFKIVLWRDASPIANDSRMANKVETIMRKLSVCPWTRDLTIGKSIITHTIENPASAVEKATLVKMSFDFQKLSQGTPRYGVDI